MLTMTETTAISYSENSHCHTLWTGYEATGKGKYIWEDIKGASGVALSFWLRKNIGNILFSRANQGSCVTGKQGKRAIGEVKTEERKRK